VEQAFSVFSLWRSASIRTIPCTWPYAGAPAYSRYLQRHDMLAIGRLSITCVLSHWAATQVSQPQPHERSTSTVHDAAYAATPLPHGKNHDGQGRVIIGCAPIRLGGPIYTHSILISGSLMHPLINHNRWRLSTFSPVTMAKVAAKQRQTFCIACRIPATPSHVARRRG
jgi:hypothetical protein